MYADIKMEWKCLNCKQKRSLYMEQLKIPEGYSAPLTIRETEVAIKEVKDHFERALAKSLHLTRVSAPLFVRPETGMNDNLNGVERPVSFGIKEQDDATA